MPSVAVRLDPAPVEPWQAAAVARLQEAGATVATFRADSDMAGLDPALVIDLSSAPLPPDALSAPARAWLTLRDEAGRPPALFGIDAVAAGQRYALCRLLRLTAPTQATIIEEGALKLVTLTWRSARARLLDLVADWPARAVRSSTVPFDLPRVTLPAVPPARPRNIRLHELRNLAARVREEAMEEHWTLGIIDAPVQALLGDFASSRVRWLAPPVGGFLADPVAWPEGDGSVTVLAEGFDFKDRVGHVVALRLADGVADPPRPVLRRPWHLSYPQLLRHAGNIYCLPEMWEAGRVQLFRADPFPDRWVEDRVLLDGIAAVDATLHHDGECWWLFLANVTDEPESRLFLFSSRGLEGPWRPHPRNPVKTDLRSARPAGPLFAHAGQLFRPAQDCTASYGGALVINRIDRLTPDDFAETVVQRLAPDPAGPYPHGLHTLAPAGAVTLIDGKRHVFSARRAAATALAVYRKRLRRLTASSRSAT